MGTVMRAFRLPFACRHGVRILFSVTKYFSSLETFYQLEKGNDFVSFQLFKVLSEAFVFVDWTRLIPFHDCQRRRNVHHVRSFLSIDIVAMFRDVFPLQTHSDVNKHNIRSGTYKQSTPTAFPVRFFPYSLHTKLHTQFVSIHADQRLLKQNICSFLFLRSRNEKK